MAFLRFSRDKRGYEHFYLVEATTNRRGKTRTRLLYWFRTPPDVKVGREPFDAEVRQALEAQNPTVQFDWRKIVETPIPSADAEKWRERRRLERAERAARRAMTGESAGTAASAEALETDEGESAGESPDSSTDALEALDAAASADLAVDAAEQQADALEPTEESMISTAASIDTGTGALRPEAPPATDVSGRRARRRRRRRRPTREG